MTTSLTYSDWVAVLEQAFRVPSEDGMKSMRELRRETGLGEDALKRRINRALEAGLIECHWALRETLRHRVIPTLVYKLNEKILEELHHGLTGGMEYPTDSR